MPKKPRPEAEKVIARHVGERMRLVREARQVKRAVCARLLGTDSSTLADIETGKRVATIFQVIGMAARFRVSADFLLRGMLVGMEPGMQMDLLRLDPGLLDRDRWGNSPDKLPDADKPALDLQ